MNTTTKTAPKFSVGQRVTFVVPHLGETPIVGKVESIGRHAPTNTRRYYVRALFMSGWVNVPAWRLTAV